MNGRKAMHLTLLYNSFADLRWIHFRGGTRWQNIVYIRNSIRPSRALTSKFRLIFILVCYKHK